MALVRDAKVGDLYRIANPAATKPVFRPQLADEPDYLYTVGWRDHPIGSGKGVARQLYTGAYIIYVGIRYRFKEKHHAFRTFKGKEVFLFRGKAFRYLEEVN